MPVDVASTWRGGRVFAGRNIAVMAIDVFDGKYSVEAKGQQPTADQHRDRIPGAMSQLMGSDGTGHADHQAGDQPGGYMVTNKSGIAGGDQVIAAELAQSGTKTEEVTAADTPDRREYDKTQQRQGQPELDSEDARGFELWRTG